MVFKRFMSSALTRAMRDNYKFISACTPRSGEVKFETVTFGSQTTELKVTETADAYYLQPTRRCYSYFFEEFFGFGNGNTYFDPEKTVFVSKTISK